MFIPGVQGRGDLPIIFAKQGAKPFEVSKRSIQVWSLDLLSDFPVYPI